MFFYIFKFSINCIYKAPYKNDNETLSTPNGQQARSKEARGVITVSTSHNTNIIVLIITTLVSIEILKKF